LANCLHIKVIDTYLTIVFKASLHPYIQLSIDGMKHEALIKYKEVVVIYMRKTNWKDIFLSFPLHKIRMELEQIPHIIMVVINIVPIVI
jgi:hypothetical protein